MAIQADRGKAWADPNIHTEHCDGAPTSPVVRSTYTHGRHVPEPPAPGRQPETAEHLKPPNQQDLTG